MKHEASAVGGRIDRLGERAKADSRNGQRKIDYFARTLESYFVAVDSPRFSGSIRTVRRLPHVFKISSEGVERISHPPTLGAATRQLKPISSDDVLPGRATYSGMPAMSTGG